MTTSTQKYAPLDVVIFPVGSYIIPRVLALKEEMKTYGSPKYVIIAGRDPESHFRNGDESKARKIYRFLESVSFITHHGSRNHGEVGRSIEQAALRYAPYGQELLLSLQHGWSAIDRASNDAKKGLGLSDNGNVRFDHKRFLWQVPTLDYLSKNIETYAHLNRNPLGRSPHYITLFEPEGEGRIQQVSHSLSLIENLLAKEMFIPHKNRDLEVGFLIDPWRFNAYKSIVSWSKREDGPFARMKREYGLHGLNVRNIGGSELRDKVKRLNRGTLFRLLETRKHRLRDQMRVHRERLEDWFSLQWHGGIEAVVNDQMGGEEQRITTVADTSNDVTTVTLEIDLVNRF